MSLDEALQLGAGLFEQVAAVHQIASLGRLVDLGAAFLVIENVLQIGRQARIGAKQVDEFDRLVVQAMITQFLEEPQGRSRIFVGPERVVADAEPDHSEQHQPDLHNRAAGHEGLLRFPAAKASRPFRLGGPRQALSPRARPSEIPRGIFLNFMAMRISSSSGAMPARRLQPRTSRLHLAAQPMACHDNESMGRSGKPWRGLGCSQVSFQGPVVSRYFKYKSIQSLRDDIRKLGLDVELDDDLTPLLAGLQMGSHRVGNLLAIQPMEGCDGNPDGTPGELTLRRYRRFGAGGAKLIWGEACAVVPEGRANPRQLVINEATAPALEQLVATCRREHLAACGTDHDLLIGLQLTHSGRYSFQRPILAQHDPLLDPRTIVNKATGAAVTLDYPLISDAELDRLMDDYAAAARLAYRIGFDFIDLKQCHRYLLNELLAARTRPGKYGGPFENRSRWICSVVARIRSENPGRLIATRLNVHDGLPYTKGPDALGMPAPLHGPGALLLGQS